MKGGGKSPCRSMHNPILYLERKCSSRGVISRKGIISVFRSQISGPIMRCERQIKREGDEWEGVTHPYCKP